MERYLHASREKAGRLKDLTDQMFRYFLVYAAPEMEADPQPYDGVILMEQLLAEPVIRLTEEGFSVNMEGLSWPCWVRADVPYLQRALDNVFSNVQKHADRRQPVTVSAALAAGWLIIQVENGVPHQPNPAESTRIGLRTCRKILQAMGGTFTTRQEQDRFMAELTLPVIPAPEGMEDGSAKAGM